MDSLDATLLLAIPALALMFLGAWYLDGSDFDGMV